MTINKSVTTFDKTLDRAIERLKQKEYVFDQAEVSKVFHSIVESDPSLLLKARAFMAEEELPFDKIPDLCFCYAYELLLADIEKMVQMLEEIL